MFGSDIHFFKPPTRIGPQTYFGVQLKAPNTAAGAALNDPPARRLHVAPEAHRPRGEDGKQRKQREMLAMGD